MSNLCRFSLFTGFSRCGEPCWAGTAVPLVADSGIPIVGMRCEARLAVDRDECAAYHRLSKLLSPWLRHFVHAHVQAALSLPDRHRCNQLIAGHSLPSSNDCSICLVSRTLTGPRVRVCIRPAKRGRYR
ncbi:hypothetical protein COLO4_02564 [Corchorus olitorius]|uniref:Uncharacterized protein n=1 Tax=Corchorus olitorius TaxID=93759 RepID=A0A1R3L0V5_9ROSI|nr:hypothetical protein COLO4_02564 [Corchorus olitorius]